MKLMSAINIYERSVLNVTVQLKNCAIKYYVYV